MKSFSTILMSVGLASVWLGVIMPGCELQFTAFLSGAIIFAIGFALMAAKERWFEI
jgi:hypothetical protein